ncbi:MAG: amidohydrolase [Eubacterium sp.]|nr:amidohydrolase [Eubacterium sp.]
MDFFEKLPEAIKAYLPEALKLRRELHRIPEAGFEEYKTQAYILDYLRGLGYAPETVCGTGVALYIPGNGEIPETIALRTDMDALSLTEETGLDFASEHPGMMHACGHDGHMTMMLLLAKYLKAHPEDQPRNVLMIFQPAEEGPGGADPMVKSGIFEKYKAKAIVGYHLFPFVEEGVISTTPGPMMAMTSEVYIDVLGKSGHAADPDKGVDAIVAAADFVSSLQKIVSRTVSPNDSALLSIGTINGGTRMNIIADKVSLSGTMRSFSEEVHQGMKQRVFDMARGIEAMYHCRVEVNFVDMYPPVINSEALFNQIWPLCGDKKHFEKVMLAEDFAFYGRVMPCLFMGLGVGNAQKGFDKNLHTQQFNFDEKILLRGMDVYRKIVERPEAYEV